MLFKKIAAVALTAILSVSAFAADEAAPKETAQATVAVRATTAPASVRTERPARRFFGRLMELERRKNAWLRRVFLD